MKTHPVEQCRFFSAEDAVRIALQAYYNATKHIIPPEGEEWFEEGQPYASGGDFADAFCVEVRARIGILAMREFGQFRDSDNWQAHVIAREIDPEVMKPLFDELDKFRAEIDAENEGVFIQETLNTLPLEENAMYTPLQSGVENAA